MNSRILVRFITGSRWAKKGRPRSSPRLHRMSPLTFRAGWWRGTPPFYAGASGGVNLAAARAGKRKRETLAFPLTRIVQSDVYPYPGGMG